MDGYYKLAHDLIDEGQFGAPIILSVFNYAHANVYGVEFTGSYNLGNWSAYGNLSVGRERATQVASQQFNFSPADLAYIASNYIYTDHSQWVTASGGIAYTWLGTRFSADMLYGSGLRQTARNGVPNGATVPPYVQVNVGVSHRFDQAPGGPIELSLNLINAFDQIYEIRSGIRRRRVRAAIRPAPHRVCRLAQVLLSEARHINLLAALVVTALEVAMFVFGMARVAPPFPSPAIAVRLIALPAPVPPEAMPVIEIAAPILPAPLPEVKPVIETPPMPKPPDDARPISETQSPAPQTMAVPAKLQPLPAVPAAKPRPPLPHREATQRPRQTGSPMPAPTTSPRTESVPTRAASPPGGGTMGARAIYRPMPEIPEEIRHRPVTLIAVARFRVAADGAATVELIQPTPDPRFNTALLATLRTWRFFPAVADGRPVASTVDIRIPISVR